MRVLLLQEMSGVHTELRHGLKQLGIDVDIATLGDGNKGYGTDIYLGNNKSTKLASISRALTQLSKVKKFNSYNVIQTISPGPFHKLVSPLLQKLVFNNQKKIVYVAAGSDPIYRNFVRNLEYWPPHDSFENKVEYNKFHKLATKFNNIIPVCWEYEYTMHKAGFSTENIIPFPINLENHPIKKIEKDKKLKIFHPINRPGYRYDFKGTLLIQQAFEKLKEKYSDKAEFISVGGLNHKDYDKLTNDVDVIVDQAYSYSYGMSAAYGLAKGKVVLSGLESITRKGHYKECPIINIKPNIEIIKASIEKLIKDKELVNNLSIQSREFAEKFHDASKVAQQYMDIYTK